MSVFEAVSADAEAYGDLADGGISVIVVLAEELGVFDEIDGSPGGALAGLPFRRRLADHLGQ